MELDAYFPRIRPHVKGCPDIVIRETLRLVLRDVCYRANIWPYKTTLYLVKDIEEYPLDPLPNTEVATVQAIIRPDGTRLESRDSFPPFMTTGTAQFYRHFERGVITVAPKPSQNLLHDIEMTLMPAIDANEVPSSVYADTAEFAPWGVLSHLQMIEQEGWHNPQQAEYNRRRYERSLRQKRIRGLAGISNAEQTAQRRRFV